MALGKDTQRQSRHTQNVGKIHRTDSETADDGHYVVMRSMAEFANHAQSLRLFVEEAGIEQVGAHPIRTILERFRGQGSTRTRPKNTSKTRYRTFL